MPQAIFWHLHNLEEMLVQILNIIITFIATGIIIDFVNLFFDYT